MSRICFAPLTSTRLSFCAKQLFLLKGRKKNLEAFRIHREKPARLVLQSQENFGITLLERNELCFFFFTLYLLALPTSELPCRLPFQLITFAPINRPVGPPAIDSHPLVVLRLLFFFPHFYTERDRARNFLHFSPNLNNTNDIEDGPSSDCSRWPGAGL